jgi:hypothetical protein
LFLRYLAPNREAISPPKPVLYVNGGTFPSGLSIAHRFDGRSWLPQWKQQTLASFVGVALSAVERVERAK